MDLSFWEMLVLAVVQGVTEFLPVSSSGHLVIAAQFMAGGDELTGIGDVNIVLHLGTLGSIGVFYWHRIFRLLTDDRSWLWLIAVGTLPAVLVGLPLKMLADDLLENSLLAGYLLIATGIMLIWVTRRHQPGKADRPDARQALLIGFGQAVAILPGLSRSGTTIAAGLRLGLSAQAAATFSFLLAVPAILGAGTLEVLSLVREPVGAATPVWLLATGAATSFLVGLLSLHWLIRWLESGRLWMFAFWCIPLGLLVIALRSGLI